MNTNVSTHSTDRTAATVSGLRTSPRHKWLWLLPLLLLGAAGLTHLVQACTQAPPNPPTIIVMPLANGCVKIVICDYQTFGTPTNPPMFCACALNQVGPIAAIKSVELQLTNGLPLPGFHFNANANAGAYFNATAGGNWQGYLSSVTQNIPPRIPIKIVITVQLAVGSSPHDLANALAAVGPIIATSGAQPNGTPIADDHLAVMPAGPIVVMPASELVPVITDVTPGGGGEGTLIAIIGHNFGFEPQNLCAIIMNGPTSIPLEVLSAEPTLITARLGPVPPDAVPGPIGIAVGHGGKGFFKPAFADVDVAQPAWVWVRDPNGPDAMSPGHFNPIPSPPPVPGTQTRWFFSGPPTNGMICVYLDGPWPNPAKVRIQARAHDHERGIGRDLEAYCIEFPASGSPLDCAARICDSIRCAFMQQGMVSVNCRVDPIPGTSIVKLTLSMPDGRIGWGNLNVCVEPGLPAADPVITSITPPQGPAGTIIRVRGTNFPTDPNDICAVVMLPDNRSVPMEVIAATPGEITAILGAVPLDAQPGPIMIGRGNGRRGKFRPAFFDVFVADDVWVWEKKTGAGNSPQVFIPIPTQPPPTQQWFFSGPPTTDGKLSVFIDQPWPVGGAKVRIEARAHDHQRGIGRDLSAVHIEIRPEAGTVPTALSCGERICDVVVCAFMQQAGLAVNAQAATDPLSGGTRLTLSLPDGNIGWGNFNICIEPLPTPVNPVITTITPLAGRAGDIITIRGTGFGNNPNNICAVVMNGGVSIPMQAIKATDTEIRVVLGQVPPNAVPGPIMIGLGEGNVGRFRPAFFDIFVADDVWTWNRTGGATMTAQNFTPIPEPFSPASDSAPRWFFSGPPTNGMICLFMDGPWPQPAILRIQARAHDHARGIGRDLSAYEIRIEGGSSLLDCAYRICDTIRCAFMQQAGLAVECTVQQVGTNTVKLTLSLPDGSIGWGNLNVCVEQGPVQPAPVVTTVTPATGREGDIITIRGTGFGNNPDNLCVVAKPAGGNEAVPLEVLTVSNDVIRAVLGPVSPTAGSNGPVMVGLGRGGRDFFTPALTNIVVRKPVWVWDRNNGPGGMGGAFRPIPNQPNPTNAWFWSGPPTNGMLMVTIQGNWPANAFLRIEARAHDHVRQIGHDLRAICIQFPVGGTLAQCAAQICDSIRCAFAQQGIIVNCQVVPLTPPTQIKLILTIPGGNIHWGNFNICVSTATPDPVIFGVTPPLGGEGTLVRIRGTNFPTDPNDVCMVAMGPPGSPTANQAIPFEVISSVSTQIVGVLGPVPQNAQPGPIMIGVGEGAMGRFRPAFFDIFVEQDVWVWQKTGPAVQTPPTATFLPIPPMPMPGCPRWYFSGPPTNGVLCLTLSNNCPWPRPAMIRIEARAHDHVKKVGRDLRAVKIRFDGGSTTLDCAKRICDVVRCAFFQQAGLEVNCTVAVLPNGDVKLTLSLPEGQIGWGNFNVCVDPITQPTPIITSITPALGGEGTLVTVRGTNFPTDPNDVCMVTMGQVGTPGAALSTPFEVISATTTQIVGRLGAVDPQANAGPIMIGVGDGQRGYFRPAFFDVFAELPTWTWVRNGPAANSAGNFTPLPGTTQGQWFFSGPPNANGELCVTLFGSWPVPAKIQIQARAHDHQLQIGRDLQSFCIVLPGGGSTLDCAKRICDVIRCAFLQQAGIVVNCTVNEDTTGLGGVKLTLSLPEGRIDWGNFNICVTGPSTLPTPIIVTGVFPQTGGEGDIVTITGTGFGNNPDNVCAVIMDGPRSIPLRVLTTVSNVMTAEIGAVPPGTGPGQIMVGLGQGNMGRFRPAFFDVFVDDTWTWNRAGGPATIAPITFIPQPRPPLPFQRWYFGQPPSNGVVCLYLTGRWPDPAQVRIEARVHDHNTGVGHDLRATNVQWGSFSMNWTGAVHVIPMTLVSCAERICDTIACAFWQQASVRVNCEVITIDDDTVKLVLSIPGGSVDWGNFNVCVSPVNGDPGPVIEVVRNPVLANQIPTIDICWPRARAGYCLEERGNLHPDFIWVPAPDATGADATRLKLRVPMDERMKAFRLFKMPPLLSP